MDKEEQLKALRRRVREIDDSLTSIKENNDHLTMQMLEAAEGRKKGGKSFPAAELALSDFAMANVGPRHDLEQEKARLEAEIRALETA